MSLGVITLGFTYLIGLIVFIVGCVHFAKSSNRAKKTKNKFWIALTLAIVIPVIATLLILSWTSMLSFSSFSLGLGF